MPVDVIDAATAPALSATSDRPLAAPTPPPTSASAHPADIAAGRAVPERGPIAKAAATASDTTQAPGETPAPEIGEAPPAPETPATETPPAETAPPEPKGVAKRLAELTRERETAKRLADVEKERADAALATAATLEAELAKARERPAEAPAPKPRPQRTAFDTPDAYDAALIEWSANETAARVYAEVAARQTAAEKTAADKAAADARAASDAANAAKAKTISDTWAAQREKALTEMPDYAEVAEADDVQITQGMAGVIVTSPVGTKLAYHLGKNKAEAARIAALPAQQMIYEMGVLAATLSRSPPPAVSRAPAPITPVGGAGAAREKPIGELTMAEYAARRLPQINGSRKPFLPDGQRGATR